MQGLKSVEVAHVQRIYQPHFCFCLYVSPKGHCLSQTVHVLRNYNFYCLLFLLEINEYLARLVWWEKRGSAPLSIFALHVWIWGTEQVFGGTWARETTECYCLGTSVSEMTINLPLQLTGSYFQ